MLGAYSLGENAVSDEDAVNMEEVRLHTTDCNLSSLPDSWRIPIEQVELQASQGRPVVLGKGGFGLVRNQDPMNFWPANPLINSLMCAISRQYLSVQRGCQLPDMAALCPEYLNWWNQIQSFSWLVYVKISPSTQVDWCLWVLILLGHK